MKLHLIVAAIISVFLGSCSTMDLGGSLPLPFTEPATSVKADLDLRPFPPRFCVGLDLVPTTREESETAE